MKTRQKIALILLLITFALSFIVMILPVDQVILGFSSHNGVDEITLVPKPEGILRMLVVPVVISLIWNSCSNYVEKKIEAEPENMNYRAKVVLLDLFFGFMNSIGAIIGIINIVSWLIDLF